MTRDPRYAGKDLQTGEDQVPSGPPAEGPTDSQRNGKGDAAMGRSKSRSDGPVARRYVDMWAFLSMHPTNVDLLQRLKSADDRQFGTNMDVCGSVSQRHSKRSGWDKTHLFGIRSDVWDPHEEELQKTLGSLQQSRRDQLRREIKRSGRLDAKQTDQLDEQLRRDPLMSMKASDIEHRRLVIKMFKTTGERIRWTGTIEEITTREVHNSIGSRRAVLSLAVLLPGYEYLVTVQQNHRTLRIPSIFTFCFYDEDQDRMWYVDVKRKWFSFGADFTIESGGRKIGEIDGKLLGFGYNAYVRVHEPSLAENGHFVDLLTLFAATVGYHRAMRRSVKRRVRAALSGGAFQHVVEDEEFWLLKNPRRRAA
jgi:hypothetical protein